MKTTLLGLAFAGLFAGLTVAPLSLTTVMAATAHSGSSAEQQLRTLYNSEFAWREAQLGRIQDTDGGRSKPGPHLPAVDAATQAARLVYWNKVLAQLNTIALEQLSPEEKINAAVFRQVLKTLANDVKFKAYEQPFNSDTFFWSQLSPSFGGFETAEEYRNYISRLRDIPRHFDQQTVNMKAGLARGFSVPRVTLTGRDDTIVPYTRATEDNPLYGPLKVMPASIPAPEQAQLQAEARQVIDSIAVRRPMPGCWPSCATTTCPERAPRSAAEALPDGKAYYQAQIEKFTTLDLTPEQIHQMGLDEVANIHAEMQASMKETGFKGDPGRSCTSCAPTRSSTRRRRRSC